MRRFLGVFVAFLIPATAIAGLCDKTWDGDKLVQLGQGRAYSQSLRLNDQNGQAVSFVTIGQLNAFYQAKQGVAQVTGRTPKFVICDSDQPNAFATGSGNGDVVGVTVGMLKLADGDKDMAAAVIGHEYAHHMRNHMQNAQARDLFVGLLGIVVGAALDRKMERRTGVSGLGLDIGNIGATLASRKFDRDQEREADEVGFEYLVRAGFNPTGAIRLAERLMEKGYGNSSGLFFDTHPGWDERAERFRKMIASDPEATRLAGTSSPARQAVETSAATSQAISLLPVYQASDAQKAYLDGLAALRQKDFSIAVQNFRSAAEAGHPRSQAMIGYLYQQGQYGLPLDQSEAVRLYKLSVDQGDSQGQVNLGAMIAAGKGGLPKDEAEAVRLFRLSADQGNGQGQAALGIAYQNGMGGLPKDEIEGTRLFRLAADQGNALGRNNLGAMYQYGKGGLQKDEVEAVRLYRLAADQGNPLAQLNLAMMYAYGKGGLEKNEVETAKYLKLSATQGNAMAQASLGQMYLAARGGLPQDEAEALRLFRLSVAQNNALGQANLGYMYMKGTSLVPKDPQEALRLLRFSADQGSPSGMNNLAAMYEYGSAGLPKDRDAAIALYKKAAAAGNAMAERNLKRLGVE